MEKIDKIARDALSDLDSLMKSAREVVSMVQKYAVMVQETHGDEIVSETTSEAGERSEMEAILLGIGIVSPVTKFSAGRLYHKELSRQLADVLLTSGALRRMGGTASLTDLYCLFNRARGTELVSPDDFVRAAELLDTLNVGLRFRRFPSGVLAVCLNEVTDGSVMRLFETLLQDPLIAPRGLSATLVSQRLGVSVALAKEQLLACESARLLCRDETIEGIFFFANLFPTFVC
jgi:ESCRT-II complex subunit VPS36